MLLSACNCNAGRRSHLCVRACSPNAAAAAGRPPRSHHQAPWRWHTWPRLTSSPKAAAAPSASRWLLHTTRRCPGPRRRQWGRSAPCQKGAIMMRLPLFVTWNQRMGYNPWWSAGDLAATTPIHVRRQRCLGSNDDLARARIRVDALIFQQLCGAAVHGLVLITHLCILLRVPQVDFPKTGRHAQIPDWAVPRA